MAFSEESLMQLNHQVAERPAHFATRFLVLSLIFAPLLPARSRAETLPDFRPALMGSAHSLVNIIDAKGLVKKGQKDAVIFFTAAVPPGGRGGDILVYRGTPGSDLLRQELLRRSHLAFWKSAIYDHQEVGVNVIGTVVFVVRNGEPHLRVFLNQQEADLKAATDFVAPQLTGILHLESPKNGLPMPSPTPPWKTAGVALLDLDVDLKGYVDKVTVAYEYPSGKNVGASAAAWAKYRTFIPGYRNGKPVTCRFTFPMLFMTGSKTLLQ